jgi:S1-C subfamily serine protease
VAALASLSDGLAGIVDTVGTAVVRVEARHRLPSSGIVWSADGVVVTAEHSVERDEQIRIGLANGEIVTATLAGRDPTTDVAVLRAEIRGVAPPEWVEPGALRAGHLVLSLGRPGRTIRAALGVISAVADDWRGPGGARLERYIQVDTPLARGFSGGPLVDVSGRVVGLNTSGLLRWASLAVPLPTLRRVIDVLLEHGRIRRGYLGIGAQPIRLPSGLQAQLGQQAGLVLISVEPGSPAERGGLLLGDVVLSLGGVAVSQHADLMSLLTADQIGTAVSARILRGGAVRELTVEVGERA